MWRVGAGKGRTGHDRIEQTGHGRLRAEQYRTGQDRTWQSRAGQGQDRAGQIDRSIDRLVGRSINKQIDR